MFGFRPKTKMVTLSSLYILFFSFSFIVVLNVFFCLHAPIALLVVSRTDNQKTKKIKDNCLYTILKYLLGLELGLFPYF